MRVALPAFASVLLLYLLARRPALGLVSLYSFIPFARASIAPGPVRCCSVAVRCCLCEEVASFRFFTVGAGQVENTLLCDRVRGADGDTCHPDCPRSPSVAGVAGAGNFDISCCVGAWRHVRL